jgi:hypothetical protein
VQWISGVIGGALDFDGTNDYVEVAGDNSLTNATTFTVACWLQSANDFDNRAYIRRDGGWFIRKSSTGDAWEVVIEQGGANVHILASGHSFPDMDVPAEAGWHHYAVVIDNYNDPVDPSDTGEVTFYLDGVKLGDTLTYVNRFEDTTGSLYIGQYDTGFRWDGYIDDMRFYTEILSDAEILALYELGQ